MSADPIETSNRHWDKSLLIAGVVLLCLPAILGAPLLYIREVSHQVNKWSAGLATHDTNITDQWNFKTENGNRLTVTRHASDGRHERKSILAWGYVSDLVVEVQVKATFDYSVKTDRRHWKIEARRAKQGNVQLRVTTPDLEIDPSDIHVEFLKGTTRDGSLWFDKTHATNELMSIPVSIRHGTPHTPP